MILNGLKNSDSYSNIISASFDPTVPSYFAKVFNTDPFRAEEAGYYLYTHYDVHPDFAVLTGSGVGLIISSSNASDGQKEPLALLLTSSMARGNGAATSTTNVGVPDFESFTDRFATAQSPSIISQQFGGTNKDIFKVHARDDGANGNASFKITIENVQASANPKEKFGKFDLLVRKFEDSDLNPKVLESFRGLSLDPSSDRYVSRVIGDSRAFYDFDRAEGSQKLVLEGKYPNNSQYIRVEESADLRNRRLDDTSIPLGVRGLPHLVTSGTSTPNASILTGSHMIAGISVDEIARTVQPPVPLRETIAVGISPKQRAETSLTWGVQFEVKSSVTEPNKNQALDPTIIALTKYFPSWHTSEQNAVVSDNAGTADVGGCVLDVDKFNNNVFTLERVEVITGSNDRPDSLQWSSAAYRRDGTQIGTLTDRDGTAGIGSRFLDPTKDFDHQPTRKFLKYTFPLQGGFDGLNIFDKNKFNMTNTAVRREMDDASESGVDSATVASIRKAVDVMEEKADVDIQLLAIPGIRHESVTDYAVDSVERRFDALYLMDIEQKDSVDTYVTSSAQFISVANTVSRFISRALDSSFAAAYFPDVIVTDPSTNTNVQCPPSVSVLGAFSLNDRVAHPWFAPAGFTRGALKSVIESQVKLNRNNLDDLYSADVNPLTSFAHTPGVVVFGQKTLQAAQSALDRVNVRRLLIDVRRKVRSVANTLLFEPNREDTLERFSATVTPILVRIQQQQGLDRFRVQIDTSTTTQADVENNTIRGKIFLQPTRSVEFISLDFVVTNAGAEV
jgi:phage tail sheath protein FI